MKSMGIPPSEDDGMKEMNTYYLKVQGENYFFLSPTPPLFFFVRIDNQQFLGG